MKLGFEYFAPRIIDEMNKNGGEFEKTFHWQSWQRQMKLYSDKVMAETLQSLLSVPQATLDAVNEKFNQFIAGLGTTTTDTSASDLGSEIQEVRLDTGQGTRRRGEGDQNQGKSLFELDQLKRREEALRKELEKAKAKLKIDTTVKPTTEQQNTVLSPSFVSSLTKSDLLRGGQRTRSTRQGLIQWTGTHMFVFFGGFLERFIWSRNKWTSQGKSQLRRNSIVIARQQVNAAKSSQGSSYVLEFSNNRWFLISDGHIRGF